MRISASLFSSRLASVLRAAGLLVALLVLAPSASQAQTWMVSTDAFIKLGVMDKFGQLGPYTARFVVTNQKTGKSYSLTREVTKGQNGVDVVFPSPSAEIDYFKTDKGEAASAQPGTYVWECQVAGQKVVSGKFDFPKTANDVNTVVVDPKPRR